MSDYADRQADMAAIGMLPSIYPIAGSAMPIPEPSEDETEDENE